jgi:hypothetical protein
MFSGCGRAFALVCVFGSDVSTSSSCEKKVDRSGRRGGGCAVSSFVEMLCSTAENQTLCCYNTRRVRLTFVARHLCSEVPV